MIGRFWVCGKCGNVFGDEAARAKHNALEARITAMTHTLSALRITLESQMESKAPLEAELVRDAIGLIDEALK